MDSKRPHRHRALIRLLSLVCIIALTSSCASWVKDETDDCPYGFWLRLHYTYNILDVEAAPEYVTDAYVYVYDTDGNFVKRIFATKEDLAANSYRVRVEGIPEGDYHFVVWSGIGNSQYAVSGDTQTKDTFRLALAAGGGRSAVELPGLYFGSLQNVHYDKRHVILDVSLIKDTNQLACLVVPVTEQSELNPGDYTMKVVTSNGVIDADNQVATDEATIYEPFFQDEATFDDPEYGQLHGLRFSIMTLRLLADRDCRIILEKTGTGQAVFNISFPEYVGMIGTLYTNPGREVSVQEYLDRQDFHSIVFFLSGDLEQLLQLQVNSWRLRAYHHVKL